MCNLVVRKSHDGNLLTLNIQPRGLGFNQAGRLISSCLNRGILGQNSYKLLIRILL